MRGGHHWFLWRTVSTHKTIDALGAILDTFYNTNNIVDFVDIVGNVDIVGTIDIFYIVDIVDIVDY